jgi:GT2 family glycosyltransferase
MVVLFTDCIITFCIMTLRRTPWLKKTLSSIKQYCPVPYSVKVLSQGPPDKELIEFLEQQNDKHIELVVSRVNLGYGGGRKLLAQLVDSPFTMMLDDDLYLTKGAISLALNVLQENGSIGAVSMPMYDVNGRMLAHGGKRIIIQNGVIHRRSVILDFNIDWMKVNDLSAGAMLYRTEMHRSFSWDGESGYFEDLDKSLQIIGTGWEQAIITKGRLIHDRSWVTTAKSYGKVRLDGLYMRRSYHYIRKKWRLRLDLFTHILFELVYPGLTLTRCLWLYAFLTWFIQERVIRGKAKH